MCWTESRSIRLSYGTAPRPLGRPGPQHDSGMTDSYRCSAAVAETARFLRDNRDEPITDSIE